MWSPMRRHTPQCSTDTLGDLDFLFKDDQVWGNTPRSPAAEEAMEICCDDSPIIIYDECTLACIFPDSLLEEMDETGLEPASVLMDCLQLNAPSNGTITIVGGSVSGGVSMAPNLLGLGMGLFMGMRLLF